MLSESQLSVLRQLDELGGSSLSAVDQRPQVTAIDEQLQTMEDQAQYEQLIAPTTALPQELAFIALCRQRLIGAQQKSLANYERLRRATTRQTAAERAPAPGPAHGPPPAEDDPESLEHSMQEARSDDITKVLQRMHTMAQGEVLKGELNISELDMSSRTLRELQEKYSGVDVLLNGSRRLVKILDEADKWDRRCMQASLGFLALVMCYIVYRRILSGPIKLLVWSTLKLFGVVRLVAPRGPARPSALASAISSASASTLAVGSTFLSHAAVPTVTGLDGHRSFEPRVGGVDQSISFEPTGWVAEERTGADPTDAYTRIEKAADYPIEDDPQVARQVEHAQPIEDDPHTAQHMESAHEHMDNAQHMGTAHEQMQHTHNAAPAESAHEHMDNNALHPTTPQHTQSFTADLSTDDIAPGRAPNEPPAPDYIHSEL